MMLVSQTSKTPTRKMFSVATAGAVLTAVLGLLAALGVEVPQAIQDQAAEGLEALFVAVAAGTAIVQFVVGYFTRDSAPDVVVVEHAGEKGYDPV